VIAALLAFSPLADSIFASRIRLLCIIELAVEPPICGANQVVLDLPFRTRPFDAGRVFVFGDKGWCGFGLMPIMARRVASMRFAVSSALY